MIMRRLSSFVSGLVSGPVSGRGRFRQLRPALTLGLVLAVAGCSGSSRTVGPGPDLADEGPEVDIRSVEDFDASSYRDEPAPPPAVVHDVPESLMTGRAASDVRRARSVQGFRIQVHASLERDVALQLEEEVTQWWNLLLPEERPIDYAPATLPVEMRFVTPYYRVRVGAFETRAAAEAFLGFLGGKYPDAFLVLDTITVYR